MRLTKLSIQNYRSICSTGEIVVEPLQALVGENNAGKSNLLRALQCFLTSGAGGMKSGDFNDPDSPSIIECEFDGLSDTERRHLKQYLLGNRVILRKELRIEEDDAKGRLTVKAEYHGYQAEPQAEHLSITKIENVYGSRPNWQEIATQAGILDYVQNEQGRVNKTSYKAGLERYFTEHEVQYDEPVLGETQALGLPQNLLRSLPEFYLLPAITDYSDEVDRRSTSSVFRRLMADLAERMMQVDPRYQELEAALSKVRELLNDVTEEDALPRLAALVDVEASLNAVVQKLMPTVQSVSLGVEVDTSRDIFSKGVSIKIDDGVLTDVLDKGHGMQRSLVFSLLQMLISSARNVGNEGSRPIILAIEEPELYIHPHSQRLVFRVLKEFAGIVEDEINPDNSDQVIYTTHSPAFVEVWNYERIGVVQKPNVDTGTVVCQANAGVLGNPDDRKTFKMITSFGLKHNEVFFARYAILVEGPEDEVGIIATARKLGRISELPDELGISIIVSNGKGDIPKFQKVLNSFGLDYSVLLELDGHTENHPQNASIIENLNGNKIAQVPSRVEDMLSVGRHFDDQRHAKQFFSDVNNINADFEHVVEQLLP